MRIVTIAAVPDEHAREWLEQLRNFAANHRDCQFELAADAPNISIAEMKELIRIEPRLTFEGIVKARHLVDDEE